MKQSLSLLFIVPFGIIGNPVALDNERVQNPYSSDYNRARISETTRTKDLEVNRNATIDGDLVVHGLTDTTTLDVNDTTTDTLVVNDSATISNLTVDELTVDNLMHSCDVTVGCNLILQDSDGTVGGIIKNGVPFLQNYGINNTFMGANAGNYSLTSSNNVGIGTSALGSNASGSFNVAVGPQSQLFNTDGLQNTSVGFNAMVSNSTGNNNTALGASALSSSMNSDSNTAIGNQSLMIASGANNIALGSAAGANITTGNNNIAIGNMGQADDTNTIRIGTVGLQNKNFQAGIYDAISSLSNSTLVVVDSDGQLTTDSIVQNIKMANSVDSLNGNILKGGLPFLHNYGGNTFLGSNAGNFTMSGGNNVGIGNNTLTTSTTSFSNTAVGAFSQHSNTDGIQNSSFGSSALMINSTGDNNSVFGADAAKNNTTGSLNTAFGTQSLFSNTAGNNNIALGANAGANLTNGHNNIAIGNLGVASESDTIRIGTAGVHAQNFQAGIYGVSSPLADNALVTIDSNGQLNSGPLGQNIVLQDSLNNTTGSIFKNGQSFLHNYGTDNTFIGSNAGNFTTTGMSNIGVGVNTLSANTIGRGNIAMGTFSLTGNTEGDANIGIGYSSLNNNIDGDDNIGIGQFTLTANTSGTENIALGSSTLFANTTGTNNTGLGTQALFENSSGNSNTAVGFNAGSGITSGNNNITLGSSAGLLLTTGDNNIVIGNLGVAGESDTIRIGDPNVHTNTYIAGIYNQPALSGLPIFIDADHKLGTIPSSIRFKENIETITPEIANVLLQLRGVSFNYKNDPAMHKEFGFIAEEVDQQFPDLVIYDEQGLPLTVKYHTLHALLLSLIQMHAQDLADHQELLDEHDQLLASYENLQNIVANLLLRVDALENA